LLLADTRYGAAGLPAKPGDVVRHGKAAVLVIVLLQRFVLPIGGFVVPFTLLGIFAVVFTGLARGTFLIIRVRLLLYLLVIIFAIVCFWAASGSTFQNLGSAIFLALLYLAATVGFRTPTQEAFTCILTFYVRVMEAAGVVGIIVFLLQFAGLPYFDPIRDFVPGAFVQQGYNTTGEVVFGSGLYKASGVLFLEPSFFSLFLGFAAAANIYLARNYISTLLLVAAMLTTLSGNGILALVVYFVFAIFSSRQSVLPLILGVLALLMVVLFTPVGDFLIPRTTELANPESSSSLRMVEPYRVLGPRLYESIESIAAGHGPGSADEYVRQIRSTDLIAPPPAKAFFEYGLIGGILVLALTYVVVLRRPVSVALSSSLAFPFYLVNSSLLQATFVSLSLLVNCWWCSLNDTSIRVEGAPFA
jgi:hypothetical protein